AGGSDNGHGGSQRDQCPYSLDHLFRNPGCVVRVWSRPRLRERIPELEDAQPVGLDQIARYGTGACLPVSDLVRDHLESYELQHPLLSRIGSPCVLCNPRLVQGQIGGRARDCSTRSKETKAILTCQCIELLW